MQRYKVLLCGAVKKIIGGSILQNINQVSDFECQTKPLPQMVNIPNTLYKSMQGKYFIGQSQTLLAGNGSNTWAALINPYDSHRNLFFNVFTVSNFSSDILTAELWLNTNPPDNPATSVSVSPADTTIKPKPENKARLRYVQATEGFPSGGVNIFDRIVPPKSTLASEEDGKIIVPPGGNVLLFIKAPSKEITNSIVAFGWWEAHEK